MRPGNNTSKHSYSNSYSQSLNESLQAGTISPSISSKLAFSASCGLTLVVFAIDLFTPAGIDVALFYSCPLLVCAWIRSREFVWLIATAAIILTYLGALIGRTPSLGVPMSVILTNRTLTAMALIVIATVATAWIAKTQSAADRNLLIRQLAQTFDLAQAIIRSPEGEILFWSQGAANLYGWKAEEAVGSFSHSLLHTEFPEPLELIAATLSQKSRWSGELRHQRKDGLTVWVASNWTLGRGIGVGGDVIIEVNNEITGLKRIERELIASELRFRRLSESNVVGIIIADRKGVCEANDQFLQILGYDRSQLAALSWEYLIPPEESEKNLRALQQLEESGTAQPIETEFLAKNRTRVSVLIGSVALDGTFLSFVIDQTDRNRLQRQLTQAQKLDSIGKLAGGVAHDFNNLLTIMLGNVGLLLDETEADDPRRRRMTAISNAAERAAGLTRQLLTFSRHQPTDLKDLAINDIVLSAEGILRQLIREDIRFVMKLRTDSGIIRANPTQMEQVLFNLVVNARDAMPDGGELCIETAPVTLDNRYADSHLNLIAGKYALLTVSDTGVGMPEEVKAHLFEPFYTTKEPGSGTGLGLATVYGAVSRLGGGVSVYSEVGQGTVFKLMLPVIEQVNPADAKDERLQQPKVGNATILLAEDEPALREYIRELLENSGYTVLETNNGREALIKATQFPDPIHMLLTDMVMPEMGGDELSTRFSALRPGSQILRMSGYSDRVRGDSGVGAHFIQKPFSAHELLVRVQELLEN